MFTGTQAMAGLRVVFFSAHMQCMGFGNIVINNIEFMNLQRGLYR